MDPDYFGPAPPPDRVIDLTTRGSAGQANGAWFVQVDPQPTGTGVFNPFLRIQGSNNPNDNPLGIETGYNTDDREGHGPGSVEGDADPNTQWDHSIPTDLEIVTYNGQDYLSFLLDVLVFSNGSFLELHLKMQQPLLNRSVVCILLLRNSRESSQNGLKAGDGEHEEIIY